MTSLLGAALILGQRARSLWSSNAAAGYGMVGRFWIIATGPITILLLASHFTAVMQGYFLTFVGLTAFRTLAELGLGQVIIVQVTRAAYAGEGGGSEVSPRIASLVRFSAKWFSAAGCVTGLLLGVAGVLLFGNRGNLPQAAWLPPWIATSVLVAIDIAVSGLMFPLEGAGSVRKVYFCRMVRSMVNSIVLWACIFAGLQLWSIAVAIAASVLWLVVFMLSKEGHLVQRALSPGCVTERIAWSRELLPSQWRIGLSSLAEFASFYTLTPFVYAVYGPVIAGQLGVTWQLAASVSAVAGAVVTTNFPQFSRLVASRSVVKLDRLLVTTTAASLVLCLLGVLAVGGGVLLLEYCGSPLATRLLPFSDVAILLAGVLIWHVNLSTAFFLRAHGGDPYLPVTLGGAVLMVLAEYTIGRWYGPQGILWGYALIGAFFMVPAGTLILRRKRAQFGYPTFRLGRLWCTDPLPRRLR